jgi:hypothetical protein
VGSKRPALLAFSAAFAALTILQVAAVVEPAFFPTNDGPHHAFGAFARARIADPAFDYARFFDPNVPTSANGFAELFALLEPALGWQRAHAWSVGVIVLLWALGAHALVSRIAPERRWLAPLVASLALGWPLYQGFFSFVLGSALALSVLALALRPAPSARSRALVAALLVLLALIHVIAAALCGLFVLVGRVALVEGAARERAKEAAAVALTGLPALIVVLRSTAASEGLGDGTTIVPWALRLAALGATTLGGPLWRQATMVALALSAVAALLAALLPALIAALAGHNATGSPQARLRLALGACGALLCFTPLWMPWDVGGWQHAAVRPLPMALAVLLCMLPFEKLPRAGRALAAAFAFAFAFSSALWARGLNLQIAEETADVMRALERPAPRPAGYRWPFVLVDLPAAREAGMLRWDPERGLGSLFGIAHGGFPAYAHVVSPQAHTLLLRPEAMAALPPPPLRSRDATPLRAIDDPDARRPLLEALISKSVQPDGVIVIERPEDHALWRARGFIADVEEGRVFVGRFIGCALEVKTEVLRAVTTAPAPAGPDTLRRTDEVPAGGAVLDRLPCGSLEVTGCEPSLVELRADAPPPSIACPAP